MNSAHSYLSPASVTSLDNKFKNLDSNRDDGVGGSGVNRVTIRKIFPENWLWKISVISGSSGQAVVPLTSPDTITTWLASVFSVSTANGLSVAEKPAEVITFRDMFISLDLPSTIVRGEDFCFPASVFSYYKGELPVLLTMEPSPDYENIWARKEDGQVILEKGQMQYSYFLGFMKENAVKTVRFCFTPVTIGSIAIKVSAMTNVASLSDAVERKIRVKPEGIPHSTTNSYIVTPTGGSWTENVPVTLPKDTVLGSERISVNIAGNLLGPIFDNLDDLLQKPYGCGEQNMINFSPIMSLVDFFFTTNSMTDEFRQKAVEYMLIGYQKEILYEHGTSGGYSTFGNNENTKENPSMWLTAFVTKCFSQAEILDMKYGNILAMDVDLIHRSADWMVNGKNQQRDGSFVEHGKVFNKGLQGGSSNGIALTAYTVVSLFHSLKVLNANQGLDIGAITRGMEKAVLFLETNYDSLTDPYDVCITTYALTLVDSPEAPNSLVIMEKMAKKGFGMTNWERPQKEQKNNYYWSRNSDAINIEMTSYALLTYSLLQRGTTDGLPILRWLSKQKGPNGGFISTQDTVIGIEALTSVAKDLYGAEFVPMTITVSLKNSAGSTVSVSNFEVTKDNEMILQRKDIAYQPGSEIQINAQTPANKDTSKSTVLVDLVFHFNVLSETRPVIYGMDHEVMSTADGFALSVKIWTTDGKPASMSLLEVDIPAGHHPDMEAILEMNRVISRVDVKDDRLNVYIDTNMIDGNGIKVKLPMLQIGGKLIKALGKSYKISSYYEPDVELTKKYFMVGGGSFCSMEPEIGICKYE